MEEDDKLPRFSYDLIKMLDETVLTPDFPRSANAFHDLDDAEMRRAAFTAGARSVVDMLVAWVEEMEDGDNESEARDLFDEAAPVFPRILDTSGEVREVSSSVRMGQYSLGHGLDVRD